MPLRSAFSIVALSHLTFVVPADGTKERTSSSRVVPSSQAAPFSVESANRWTAPSIAPLLTSALDDGGKQALRSGTKVILDGNVPLTKKVPIALDLRNAFARAQQGEVPNLKEPFDTRGASSDERLRRLRDDLVEALESAITRSFRSSFLLSALFAVLAVIPALRLRRVAA